MRKYPDVPLNDLLKMIQEENRIEYWRHSDEAGAALSSIIDSARALGPLSLRETRSLTQWVLTGDISYSRFRAGDRVDLRVAKVGEDSSRLLSEGWTVASVRYPSPGRIEVIIDGKPFDYDGTKEVFLFQSSSVMLGHALRRRIKDFSESNHEILGTGQYSLNDSSRNFCELFEKLNSTQKKSVQYLMENNLSGAVQGPPGTGKTQLLKAIIALALDSEMRVCLTSFTNAAVDNLLSRAVGGGMEYEWCRVGNSDRIRKDLYGAKASDIGFLAKGFGDEIEDAQLVAATLHKMAFSASVPKFDLLIVDEAGQVPMYFWPYITRLAKRVVLVGDQHQLPPVLATEHNYLSHDNIFSFVVNSSTPMLETQYRMRREIQGWSSEKFYRGKLVPDASNAEYDYFKDSSALYTDGFVVAKSFNGGVSGSSVSEAEYIAQKVERLSRSGADLSKIGIICPYRVQAGLISSTLQGKIGVDAVSKILVDTVERFQGQEREAIFLSFGGVGDSQEALRFLSNAKRLNVSVTRAKSRFYCLYDEKLWSNSFNRSSADLNEFLRWVRFGKTTIRRAA
ncbi:DEAD/DEAH box helicase [Bdellovibrio sp. HCB209]|uniref:DEAD/DEAH box helicase n=1 Tax=Bdellovibrio sp. HCB209 TaxID=3394354 RepID=UPI0039B5E6AD